MAVLFVDGCRWCGKIRVGKSAHRDADQIRLDIQRQIHGRATFRTEVTGNLIAAIGAAPVGFALSFYRDPVSGKARLHPENTPRSTLAGQAMANRDTHRRSANHQL